MGRLQGSGSAITSSWFVALGLLTLLSVSFQGAYGLDFPVGDNGDWTIPGTNGLSINYTLWAQARTFRVNDRLIFRYENTRHSVLQVTREDYFACNTFNPAQTYGYNNGQTEVELRNMQEYYFICGVPGHCANGQKMMVSVQFNNGQTSAAPALAYSVALAAAAMASVAYLLRF